MKILSVCGASHGTDQGTMTPVCVGWKRFMMLLQEVLVCGVVRAPDYCTVLVLDFSAFLVLTMADDISGGEGPNEEIARSLNAWVSFFLGEAISSGQRKSDLRTLPVQTGLNDVGRDDKQYFGKSRVFASATQ